MMIPSRPYLLRGLYQWILDNEKTPYLLVDTTVEGVQVPKEHIVDNAIVLNVAPNAIQKLSLGNFVIRFSARFPRGYFDCVIPIHAVTGICMEKEPPYFFSPEDLGIHYMPPSLVEEEEEISEEIVQAMQPQSINKKRSSHLTLVKS